VRGKRQSSQEVAAMPSTIRQKFTLYIHDDWIQDWQYVTSYFARLNISKTRTVKMLVQQTAEQLRFLDVQEPEDLTVKQVFEMMKDFFEEGKKD
jgi:hypothetical protein